MSWTRTILGAWWLYPKFFRPGKCRICNKWTWLVLRTEGAHEVCAYGEMYDDER